MARRHLKKGEDFPERKEGLLRIYGMRFCPFDHRTRLVLAHKGIPHEEIFVNLTEKPEWFLSRNPVGIVPTLELPDGRILWESAVINDYLDEVYPEKKLNPEDPYEKARQRILHERFEKSLDLLLYKDWRNPETVEEIKTEFKIQLKISNDLLKDKYFGGDSPRMCDFNMWPTMERIVSFNKSGLVKWLDQDFSTEFPNLQRWIDAMMELPAVKENYEQPEIAGRAALAYIVGENVEYDI